MLTLYHRARAVCPQKVRLTLAEKDLAFESHLLTPADLRSPAYLALNSQGYVPTLVHDGLVITESRTIAEYLEDCFPDPPLMPASAIGRAKVRNWSKQIDDSLHLSIFILSFVVSFRRTMIALSAEERVAMLPLAPLKRHIALELLEHGPESVFFGIAINRFLTLLSDMDAALIQSEWLGDDSFSLADIDYTPYLRRLEEVGLWQLVKSDYPGVRRWFDTVRNRPSYAVAMTAWESVADREREARDIAIAQPLFQAVLAA